MPSLRVVTWNLRQLKDDRSAVVDVIRALDADVVAVQEPPRGPWGRSRLRRLAHDAGLTVAVAGGGARTTALLVRPGLPVHGARSMRLAWRPGRTRRGLAFAEVAGIRVISVHLSLAEAERQRHLVRLGHLVRSTTSSGVVLAGDLNEEPGGPTRRALERHLRDVTTAVGPTFPARRPHRRLDAVLVSPGVRVSQARRVQDELTRVASDHLPVVVEVSSP
ncbi:endonuclease/exonuclease/phosphatase family protein [Actinotalea sp. Marseille-Q4924]|uniref:endonuclease/exonuclease/phosphatase family protein n=1 Tax=Actinotalea sp. Marseille-Q4924 TaxID=2866571 RepID=UPI001CE3C990|nr:endonuclease/exonuclease/phosphatase family protein [Actinotalea sp. Marseille-Q4924]